MKKRLEAKQIVDKFKLIKDSVNGLFMLDYELGERK